MRQATIPAHVAATIVAPLLSAHRHLRDAHAVAHAVAPADIQAQMDLVWPATTSTRAMLLAIWEAYPDLHDRHTADELRAWDVDKLNWEWGRAWQWGPTTREYIVAALEQASSGIASAAAAVAGTEPDGKKRFEHELASALRLVRIVQLALAPVPLPVPLKH